MDVRKDLSAGQGTTPERESSSARQLDMIREYLACYDGPKLNIMEVCGSHTAAISKNGIRGMLSDHIHLISGPGCPVCVTPSSYIDRLIELALEEHCCIVTFGDLLRVPGSEKSLSMAKGDGARVEMVYSPLDVVELAKREPEVQFVFAAVGFETTTPVYALLMQQLLEEGLENVRLLTALKTMPPVIDYLCANGAPVQGFLAPGHVCVVTGSRAFAALAKKYQIPFGVSGFEAREILLALYGIVKAASGGMADGMSDKASCGVAGAASGSEEGSQNQRGIVMNFYPSVVSEEGNLRAQQLVERFFAPADACWRGMGVIPASGLLLQPEFQRFDAGSAGLARDQKKNVACCCDQVLMGRMAPDQCPLFGKVCTPLTPQGACMVSTEGSCFSWYAG